MAVIDNEGVQCLAQPTCVSCGAPGRLIHAAMRDHLFGAPGSWNTMRCLMPDCGLAWLDPQPLPGEIGKLYATYYTHGTSEEHAALQSGPPEPVNLRRYVSTGKVALAKRVLRRLMPWRRFWFDTDYVYLGSGPPGRLLDVGCGAGDFLRVVREAGWQAEGIDFDAKAIAMARLNGVEARVGDFLSAGYPAESFDAVTMTNALETLPDPAAIFAECHRILKPGGKLVVMTPNIEAYCHYLYGPDWRGLEPPRHLYLYSATTLRRFARKAGFGHTEAFSQLRNERGVRFMAAESAVIAARATRTHRVPDAARLGRKAALRAWLGISRGEWVHLVAGK